MTQKVGVHPCTPAVVLAQPAERKEAERRGEEEATRAREAKRLREEREAWSAWAHEEADTIDPLRALAGT